MAKGVEWAFEIPISGVVTRGKPQRKYSDDAWLAPLSGRKGEGGTLRQGWASVSARTLVRRGQSFVSGEGMAPGRMELAAQSSGRA